MAVQQQGTLLGFLCRAPSFVTVCTRYKVCAGGSRTGDGGNLNACHRPLGKIHKRNICIPISVIHTRGSVVGTFFSGRSFHALPYMAGIDFWCSWVLFFSSFTFSVRCSLEYAVLGVRNSGNHSISMAALNICFQPFAKDGNLEKGLWLPFSDFSDGSYDVFSKRMETLRKMTEGKLWRNQRKAYLEFWLLRRNIGQEQQSNHLVFGTRI